MKSPRMRAVHEYLLLNGSATTKELETACGVASARDYIRRLRDRGIHIMTIEEGQSKGGARIVRYKLIEPPQDADLLAVRQRKLL